MHLEKSSISPWGGCVREPLEEDTTRTARHTTRTHTTDLFVVGFDDEDLAFDDLGFGHGHGLVELGRGEGGRQPPVLLCVDAVALYVLGVAASVVGPRVLGIEMESCRVVPNGCDHREKSEVGVWQRSVGCQKKKRKKLHAHLVACLNGRCICGR